MMPISRGSVPVLALVLAAASAAFAACERPFDEPQQS